MTSVDDVIVMSHARRWLLQCCASESETLAHMFGRGWFFPRRRPRRLVGCRHATQLEEQEFEFTRSLLPLKLVFAVAVADS